MFTKVRQVRAFESIIQQVEAAILKGNLAVGDRLPPERELQGLLDVSRNTLRESLRVLEQKGLIEVRKGNRGGIFVKEINADSMAESLGLFVQSQRITMEQISEFRQDLEGLVTHRAALQADSKRMSDVDRRLEKAEELARKGPSQWDAFMQADRDVHLALARLAGNPLHHFFLETVHTNFHRYHIHAYLPRDEATIQITLSGAESHRPGRVPGRGRARGGACARACAARYGSDETGVDRSGENGRGVPAVDQAREIKTPPTFRIRDAYEQEATMTPITLESRRPGTDRSAAAATGPSDRVRLGIERNRSTRPEVHPHRAVAVTRSYQETEGEPIAIRRGKMLYRILAEQPVTIQKDELIVGMKTLTPRGSPVYPEINCAWVERDLDRLATRRDTPFYRQRRNQAHPAGGGVSLLAQPPDRRPHQRGRAARDLESRRARRDLQLFPLAHDRALPGRLRQGAHQRHGRDHRRRRALARTAGRPARRTTSANGSSWSR